MLCIFLSIILILPQICIMKYKKPNTLSIELSKSLKFLSDDKICQDFITIENAGEEKFNLLQTISSYEDINYLDCEILDRLTYSSNKPEISEKFYFSNRTFHFLNFSNLDRGRDYHLSCNKWEELINKNIKFPKESTYTNVLAFGDWSDGDFGSMTKNFMKSYIYQTDSILFLGDMAYDIDDDWGERGHNFLKFIKDISSETPFQLSVGNHEKAENFSDYHNMFFQPNRSKNKTFYYSYDINNVHFASINSEVTFNSFFSEEYKERMLDWLTKDLSSTRKKWKIVYMHRPLYCSVQKKTCIHDVINLRNLLEEIFLKYSVDLVLSGHVHNYERVYPVYKNTVDLKSLRNENNTYFNPKYPSYVVCGATGKFGGMETQIYPPLYFSKILGNTIGICYIKITEEEMTIKHILSNNGTIFDQFNIIKSRKNLKM